ncbi:MAG: hypothetical protein AB8E82_11985 [Aureispira sp.]
MLDLSIDAIDLETSFDRIAQQLLQSYVLRVGTQRYQLTEVEFYYNTITGTFDNFAHQHPSHFLNSTWRLHGAGLDIVLKQEGDYYGGILLRGLQALDAVLQPVSDGYIDGPWNSATACIAHKGDVMEPIPFYLEALEVPFDIMVKKSPRVGLFLRNVEDLKYICKPWRYNTIPIQTKRYRQLIFLQAYVEQADWFQQLNLSARSQKNYIAYFEEGQKMKAADFVKIGTSVPATCRLFGYCYQHNLL